MVDTSLPYTVVTVKHSIQGPWCNRKVGPGKYLVQGDARRFFRNIADVKLLAYDHVSLELIDPALETVAPKKEEKKAEPKVKKTEKAEKKAEPKAEEVPAVTADKLEPTVETKAEEPADDTADDQ